MITDYPVELLLPTIALDFIRSNELGVRIYADLCFYTLKRESEIVRTEIAFSKKGFSEKKRKKSRLEHF